MRVLRQSLRLLLRQPQLSALVVVTIALGIGASTVVYSFVHAVLLTPSPYRDPKELVRVQSRLLTQGGASQGVALLDIEDYRRRARTIEDIGAFAQSETQVLGNGPPELVTMTSLNPAAINILGVAPLIGHLLNPDDDRPGGDVDKALISYALWQSRFGSDPNVVGRVLRTDQVAYTIVGVMPPGFAFPGPTSFWTTMESQYALLTGARATKHRGERFYPAVARLKPGVTIAQAEADLNAVAAALEHEFPKENAGVRVALIDLREVEVGPLGPYLRALTVGVGLFLLICCSNVASLLMIRATADRRGLAIRLAVGASRGDIVQGFLVESLLLSALGGLIGVGLAFAGVRAVVDLIPFALPPSMSVTLDGSVLWVIVLLTLGVSLLCGLAPAVQASRTTFSGILKSETPGSSARSGVRSILLVGQVALCLVLLVCAAAFTRAFFELRGINPGFHSDGLITARVVKYQPGRPTVRAPVVLEVHNRILQALRQIPGVSMAAMTTHLPFVGERSRAGLIIREGTDTRVVAPLAESDVSADYFNVMQIALLRGRLFNASDVYGAPCVVVINERAARTYWPEGDPTAPQILFGSPATDPFCQVVGVVANVRQQAPEGDRGVELYYPITQWPFASGYYVVRSSVDPTSLAGSVRRTIEATESTATVADVETMGHRMADTLWRQRLWGAMFSAFAVLALALAAVGLYGTMSYAVSQRTREIGTRVALGASPLNVGQMVVREAMALVTAGSVIGILTAIIVSQMIAGLLVGVPRGEPIVFLIATAVLCMSGFVAAAIPAYVASRTDPVQALRAD